MPALRHVVRSAKPTEIYARFRTGEEATSGAMFGVAGRVQMRLRGSTATIAAAAVAMMGPSAGESPRAKAANDPANQPA